MKSFNQFQEGWEEDRAQAAQDAQKPASAGGKLKPKRGGAPQRAPGGQKSQYHRPQSEEVEPTDEATLGQSNTQAARDFRQGQKQNDPRRQAKARDLRKKAGEARSQRRYDKMSPEGKKREDDWARDRHDRAMSSHT